MIKTKSLNEDLLLRDVKEFSRENANLGIDYLANIQINDVINLESKMVYLGYNKQSMLEEKIQLPSRLQNSPIRYNATSELVKLEWRDLFDFDLYLTVDDKVKMIRVREFYNKENLFNWYSLEKALIDEDQNLLEMRYGNVALFVKYWATSNKISVAKIHIESPFVPTEIIGNSSIRLNNGT